MKNYRQWLAELAPTFLSGPVGSRLISAIGLMADVLADKMIEALWGRFIYTADFPTDALRVLGSERMMPRYGNETHASYRARLKLAWTLWTFAGTRQSILDQLTAAGYGAELYENFEWNWDSADPTEWWLDEDADWSRFWVVLTEHPYEEHHWGDPGLVYGDENLTWGTTMTIHEVEALRRLVRQWKAGHTRCVYIIVPFDMVEWNGNPPDGTWDIPANRVPSAAYIPG